MVDLLDGVNDLVVNVLLDLCLVLWVGLFGLGLAVGEEFLLFRGGGG